MLIVIRQLRPEPGRQGLADVGLDLRLERAGGRGQVDRQRDAAVADPDVLDHAEVDEVAVQVGVLDPLEGLAGRRARSGPGSSCRTSGDPFSVSFGAVAGGREGRFDQASGGAGPAVAPRRGGGRAGASGGASRRPSAAGRHRPSRGSPPARTPGPTRRDDRPGRARGRARRATPGPRGRGPRASRRGRSATSSTTTGLAAPRTARSRSSPDRDSTQRTGPAPARRGAEVAGPGPPALVGHDGHGRHRRARPPPRHPGNFPRADTHGPPRSSS